MADNKAYTKEERDEFAIGFLAWYNFADDAQIYKDQRISIGQMLSIYEDRPFLRTDSPQQN